MIAYSKELNEAYAALAAQAVTEQKQIHSDKSSSSAQFEQNMTILTQQWRDELERLKQKHELDIRSRDASDSARREAEKAILVNKYKKKISDFKNKVQAAEDAYRQKHIQILGALDESRREVLSTRAAAEVREDNLRRELDLKDREITHLLNQRDSLKQTAKEASRWRAVALELAASIVELGCDVTFVDLKPGGSERDHRGLHSMDNDEGVETRVLVSKQYLKDMMKNSKVGTSTRYLR